MQRDDCPAGERILLNVYDLHWTNEYTSALGLGVFHSGIEVYGVEFGYGGHPFPLTGVFEMAPKCADELGDHFSFRESIVLGTTSLSDDDVRDIVESLSPRFLGDQYHLLRYNCNHFSSELAQILCGASIPSWINRLANMASSVPFIERALPREWLTPCGLQTMASANIGLVESTRQRSNGSVDLTSRIQQANDLLDSFPTKMSLSSLTTKQTSSSSNSSSQNSTSKATTSSNGGGSSSKTTTSDSSSSSSKKIALRR